MLSSIAFPKYFTSYFGQIRILLQISTSVGMNFNFILTRGFLLNKPVSVKKLQKKYKEFIYYILLTISGLLSLYLFFYKQINTNFSIIFGDPFDGAIESVLVGHWYKVASQIHSWNQTFFFYPYEDTLGYNDSYLLYGILAIPFRLIGTDILTAQEYVHISIKGIGFLSMVSMLNAITNRKSLINIFGAVLFVLMINSSIQAGHGQLLSVAITPLIFICILNTIKNINVKNNQFMLWGATTSIAYATWLLTSFYMAWFFGLFCILLLLAMLVIDNKEIMKNIEELLKNKKWQLLSLGIFFLACITPFLLIYLPTLKETNGHTYQAALHYSLKLGDLINISPASSLIWGHLFGILDMPCLCYFDLTIGEGESMVGFTPDILIAIVTLILLYWFKKNIALTKLQLSIIFAGLIALLLPISIHDSSLWWLIYHSVPGASGVRVISRLWIFLAFPFAITITMLAHHFKAKPIMLVLIMSLMLAGQVNLSPPIDIDVKSLTQLIKEVPIQPSTCKSFFVREPQGYASGDKEIDSLYRQNVTAMLISDHLNLPTINGIASFLPPDWNFSEEPKSSYNYRVHEYVKSHHVSGVCQYSIKNHIWTINPFKEKSE
jgi:hypothetical protein